LALIFISHSSRDAEPATQMKVWLESHGFDQVFLDFDKHSGIVPGADWEKTLYREIERSQAVVVILTPNWLDSKWCFAEFTQARALGKPIFPLIESPIGDQLIAVDIQHYCHNIARRRTMATMPNTGPIASAESRIGQPNIEANTGVACTVMKVRAKPSAV
jgi:hypothetical protein